MDSDSWIRLSTTSRRYQFRSDMYQARDEFEGGEESRPEFLCPFCGEDFDIVGLCCHIDEEHPVEAKRGVCPVCAKRVGMDLVGHFTSQHGNLLRVQHKRRVRRGSSNSTLSMLRRELREGNLRPFLGGSSFLVPPPNVEADPWLSSFICNPLTADESPEIQPDSSAEVCSLVESAVEDSSERIGREPTGNNIQRSLLSDKDRGEKAQRCEFVQELLLSTFLENL